MKKYFIGITQSVLALMLLFGLSGAQSAIAAEGNISNTYKYAWSENVGWQNWRSANAQATVGTTYLVGYAWGENVGWVHFQNDSPEYYVMQPQCLPV